MPDTGSQYAPLDPALVRRYEETRASGPQKYLCNSPFSNLYFGFNGGVRSCCLNPMVLGRYPENTIKEIWEGEQNLALREQIRNHDLSGGCSQCADQISSGNFEGAIARTYDGQHIDEIYPTRMEFELHNTCNLACVMCTGELSSTIRKQREGLPPLKTPYDDAFVDQLQEFIPHLHQAGFYGGEPFLMKIYYRIWDLLIELNQRCEIVVQTNATVLGSKIKSYLERGNFRIAVSLDSINRVNYEKIRVHARFDKVMENIRFFNDYSAARGKSMILGICVLPQNWQELPAFMSFANELGARVWINTVLRPHQHSMWSAGSGILKEAYELYDSHLVEATTPLQKHNEKVFRGCSNMFKDWYRHLKQLEDHGMDYRTAMPLESGMPLRFPTGPAGDKAKDVMVSASDRLSIMTGNANSSSIGNPDMAWIVQGYGDLDGDGIDETLVRDTNLLSYQKADGKQTFICKLTSEWIVQGLGDLDGDGLAEVLVRNGNQLSYLKNDGSATFIGGLDAAWMVQGIGDLDGDGLAEVLVRNGNQLSYVKTDGSTAFIGGLDPAWVVLGLGDLDGDAVAEILISRDNSLSYLKSDNRGTFIGRLEDAWVVEAIGDYDGDGDDEILIRSDALLAYMEPSGITTFIGNLERAGHARTFIAHSRTDRLPLEG